MGPSGIEKKGGSGRVRGGAESSGRLKPRRTRLRDWGPHESEKVHRDGDLESRDLPLIEGLTLGGGQRQGEGGWSRMSVKKA